MSASPASSSSGLTLVTGVAQQYEWGKLGSVSGVARLLRSSGAAASDSAPYAELWMGTHTSGPSTVRRQDGTVQTLRDYIGADLPFLFKVLSVGKALSIQAHPDTALAQRLHAERPGVYKDPHHKPELACALTPFEALCAFRPLQQIRSNLLQFPEFGALLGEEVANALEQLVLGEDQAAPTTPEHKAVLKNVFAKMMTPTPELLKAQLDSLLTRLAAQGVQPSVPASELPTPPAAPSSSPATAASLDIPSLMLRLASQYPGDVGIFAPLYLNAFSLQPGQSIFLGPNEPHAYLSGECVECMACSDNVVRAGLTPKLRDTEVLIQMLTYETHTVESALMQSNTIEGAPHTRQFAPPAAFQEFRLLATDLPAAEADSTAQLAAVDGASLLLVLEGVARLATTETDAGLPVQAGSIVLVPSGKKVTVHQQAGSGQLRLAQCATNKQA